MEATILLADAARVSDGKLDLLGAGWTVTVAEPHPFGIGIILELPWAEIGVEHSFELVLLNAGDDSVAVDASGDVLFQGSGTMRTQKPPGVLLGKPVTQPVAIGVPPLAWQPAHDYKFLLTLDGNSNLGWEASFSTLPAQMRAVS